MAAILIGFVVGRIIQICKHISRHTAAQGKKVPHMSLSICAAAAFAFWGKYIVELPIS